VALQTLWVEGRSAETAFLVSIESPLAYSQSRLESEGAALCHLEDLSQAEL
jgi:hypothetical protein